MGKNAISTLAICVKCLLGSLHQRFGKRPLGGGSQEIHDSAIACVLPMVPEIQEFDQLDRGFIARTLGQRASIGEMAFKRQFNGLYCGALGLAGARWQRRG